LPLFTVEAGNAEPPFRVYKPIRSEAVTLPEKRFARRVGRMRVYRADENATRGLLKRRAPACKHQNLRLNAGYGLSTAMDVPACEGFRDSVGHTVEHSRIPVRDKEISDRGGC
jgi:hypothetical protein